MKTKTLKLIFLLFFLIFLIPTTQAQIFKKLGKSAEKAAERAVIKKTEQKVTKETERVMDTILDGNKGETKQNKSKDRTTNMSIPGLGQKSVAISEIPNSYNFEWKYSLKVNTKDGDMIMDYFLKPNQPYFGFNSPTMNDMFMVMDTGNNIMVIYMKSEKNSSIMAMAVPDDLNVDKMKDESEDFTYEILPNKTIMGYNCKGVRATNDRHDMTMYFTNEAPVSFNDIYKSDKAQIPDGMIKYFKDGENTLMLELTMIDKKKSKQNATMECIGLEEVQRIIDKSDY